MKYNKKDKHIIRSQFFILCWKKKERSDNSVNCFECNKKLRQEYYMMNSCVYSHILDKSSYPEYEFKFWNIEICCPECHEIYTKSPKKAVNQYNKYLELKEQIIKK